MPTIITVGKWVQYVGKCGVLFPMVSGIKVHYKLDLGMVIS